MLSALAALTRPIFARRAYKMPAEGNRRHERGRSSRAGAAAGAGREVIINHARPAAHARRGARRKLTMCRPPTQHVTRLYWLA